MKAIDIFSTLEIHENGRLSSLYPSLNLQCLKTKENRVKAKIIVE